jgi:hypothetical protein
MIFDLDDALMRSYDKLPDKFMISDVFEKLPKPEYDITNDATYTRIKRQLQRMGKLEILRKFEGHWQKNYSTMQKWFDAWIKEKIPK